MEKNEICFVNTELCEKAGNLLLVLYTYYDLTNNKDLWFVCTEDTSKNGRVTVSTDLFESYDFEEAKKCFYNTLSNMRGK